MQKVEHVYEGGFVQEIEVEYSLAEIASELQAHLANMIAEGRQHGTNCVCMDRLIRQVRNYITCEIPDEIQDRMIYILREASRIWGEKVSETFKREMVARGTAQVVAELYASLRALTNLASEGIEQNEADLIILELRKRSIDLRDLTNAVEDFTNCFLARL
jgi:hypothetical protein